MESPATRTYRESFRSATHREHELQHTVRWMGSDEGLLRIARSMTTEPVRDSHLPVVL